MDLPEAQKASWKWPEDIASEKAPEPEFHVPGISKKEKPEVQEDTAEHAAAEDAGGSANDEPAEAPKPQRHYKPRTCRICLEEVLPTFEPETGFVNGFLNPKPKVTYISSEPTSGRLIRPCKCRGSQAYVHEGCLQAWRHADPGYTQKNFWECPTCKFRYRLERLKWSRLITSTLTQIALTTAIMVFAVFLLGFIADPIINMYFPASSLVSIATGGEIDILEFEDELEELNGWGVHFLKGLTSIGVLGFLKVIWAVSPFSLFRTGGFFGGGGGRGYARVGVNGRDRTETTFLIVVLIGVVTFSLSIWAWVRAWSRRTLEKASERVVDVHGADDDNDEDEDDEGGHVNHDHAE